MISTASSWFNMFLHIARRLHEMHDSVRFWPISSRIVCLIDCAIQVLGRILQPSSTMQEGHRLMKGVDWLLVPAKMAIDLVPVLLVRSHESTRSNLQLQTDWCPQQLKPDLTLLIMGCLNCNLHLSCCTETMPCIRSTSSDPGDYPRAAVGARDER